MRARIRALTKPGNLEKLSSHMQEAIQTVMDSQTQRAIDILRVYPPPKAGSRYVRTNTLRNSWESSKAHLTSEGMIATIRNDAIDPHGHHYSVRVHGDETGVGQEDMHAETGWPIAVDVLREGFRERLRRVLRSR